MTIADYNENFLGAEWIYGDEEPPEDLQYCGDEVTWVLDDAGVLTISGRGYPFSYRSHEAPWYNQRNEIFSVVVEDGVNSLESYFFEDCECSFTLPMLGDKHIFSAWEPPVPSPSEVLATLRPAPRQGTGSQQAGL